MKISSMGHGDACLSFLNEGTQGQNRLLSWVEKTLINKGGEKE